MKLFAYLSFLIAGLASASPNPTTNLKVRAGYIGKSGSSLLVFESDPSDQKNLAYCGDGHCSQLFREKSEDAGAGVISYEFIDADGQKGRLQANARLGNYSVACDAGAKTPLKPMTAAQITSIEKRIRSGDLNFRRLPTDVRKVDYAFGSETQSIYVTSAKFGDGLSTSKVFYDRSGSLEEVKILKVDRSTKTGKVINYLLANGLILHIADEPAERADLSGVQMKRISSSVNNPKILPKFAGPIGGLDSSPCPLAQGTSPSNHGKSSGSAK